MLVFARLTSPLSLPIVCEQSLLACILFVAMDEAIVSAARDQAGPECEIMVDAGGSDAYWPHGYKWALRTATMLHKYDVTWFEEALRPDDIEGYVKLTEHAPLPISSCEVSVHDRSVVLN
jgi:D-galactarolactone cycloisomerase